MVGKLGLALLEATLSKKQRSKQKTGRPAGEPGLVAAPAAASKPAAPPAAKKQVNVDGLARAAAIGLGFCGAMIGALTGINHMPAFPSTVTSAFAQAAWIGGAYGHQNLDGTMAAFTCLAGALVGSAIGYSFKFSSQRMTRSWALGAVGLTAGLMASASPLGAALGWTAGFAMGAKT